MAGASYADREDAGRVLAQHLGAYADRPDVVVLGLPRGGVVVAAAVAAALSAPLDVLVVRKLGLPSHPELAMGAIADVGDRIEVVRNEDVLGRATVTQDEFDRVLRQESAVLADRMVSLRPGRPATAIRGRTVLLVDDGVATGATMRAAVIAVQAQEPSAVVVAVPVGSADSVRALAGEVDELVCPSTPHPFLAVGHAYIRFDQTTDEEARRLLAQ